MRDWKKDTPALVIGSVGGLGFGNALAWTYYGPVWKLVQHDYGVRLPKDFLFLCVILGCLKVPGVVSAMARTRPFVWGLLPLTLFWISINGEQWYELGGASVLEPLPETLALAGGCLLLSSGSVTLVRAFWESRKRVAEETARLERYQLEQHSPKDVWPPPPA